ncbi:MAG: glycosyltransferase [Salinivirgaceae bacterium]|nr:glycosyltransferase [Salinivirgaceae bacterium]
MNKSPLFSVLIANYNNGCYLQESIDSVINQTYHNWEIIIVDDKSTDDSYSIYNIYGSDDRIHIYFNKNNRGCGFTKRKCIEMANGDLCGFLDPDDVILPRAIEIMVEKHQKEPKASVVCSRHYRCDEQLNILKESPLLQIPIGMDYFSMNSYRPLPFASFKKSLYLKTQGLSPHYLAAVDQELYFIMEDVGYICSINEFTYKYRIHNRSVAHSKNSSAGYWNVIAIYEACKRKGLNPMIYSYPLYQKYIELYSKSTSYRIGRLLLTPLIWIKTKLKK